MHIRLHILLMMLIALVATLSATPAHADIAAEREALAKDVEGWIVWTSGPRDGHDSEWSVHKMKLGEWKPTRVTAGRYARWSWDGKQLLVWRTEEGTKDAARYAGPVGSLYVMDADGRNERKVVDDVWGFGVPMDWMPDNQRILFTRRTGGHEQAAKLMILDLKTGKAEDVPGAGRANAEPQVCASGRFVAAREVYGPSKPLVYYDLTDGSRSAYGEGCCAGVSPSGEWFSNNFDGHNRITLHHRDATQKIFGSGGWDNPHWSNHDNYIASSVDGQGQLKVFKVSAQTWYTLADDESYEGMNYDWPDLFITNIDKAPKLEITAVPDAGTDWKTATAWPGDQTDLHFVFADSSGANVIRRDGKVVRECNVGMMGYAFLGRDYVMQFEGPVIKHGGRSYLFGSGPGRFQAQGDDATADLLKGAQSSKALSVEFTAIADNQLNTQDRWAVPGTLIAFGAKDRFPNFVVWQQRHEIFVQFGPGPLPSHARHEDKGTKVAEFNTRDLQPVHVILTIVDGTMTVYLNGQQRQQTNVSVDFAAWEPGELTFGDTINGDRPWRGILEGVALYSRAIGPGEAAKKFELYDSRLRKLRDDVPRYSLDVKLVDTVPIPDPESLVDYPRALVVYTYEITRGVADHDELATGKLINVVHWAVLDKQVVAGMNERYVKGATIRRFVVEPWDAHVQAHGERRAEIEDEEALLRPTYMHIGEGRIVISPPHALTPEAAADAAP